MKKIVDTKKDLFMIWMCDLYGERADWFVRQATISHMIEYGEKHKWMILEIIADDGKRVDYDKNTDQFFIKED